VLNTSLMIWSKEPTLGSINRPGMKSRLSGIIVPTASTGSSGDPGVHNSLVYCCSAELTRYITVHWHWTSPACLILSLMQSALIVQSVINLCTVNWIQKLGYKFTIQHFLFSFSLRRLPALCVCVLYRVWKWKMVDAYLDYTLRRIHSLFLTCPTSKHHFRWSVCEYH